MANKHPIQRYYRCRCVTRDQMPHLRIDDRGLRKRHAERRACIANCVVGAFFVHYETNVSPWRGNAEQVGRRYECGTVIMLLLLW